jgi:molybdopterin/thiamine biosynthesis adenylyltransferase
MTTPLVYMPQADLQRLYETHQLDSAPVRGFAVAVDEGEVFHVSASLSPPIHRRGHPCGCVLHVLPQMPTAESAERIATTLADEFWQRESAETVSQCVILLVARQEDQVRPHVFISATAQGRVWLQAGQFNFIPGRSELYSRSQGLLETSVLKHMKVGVVGVGSVGSTVAVELAKASVGSFVLIDADRLELSNVSRHMCGIDDLGRYKTKAVRDLLLGKNPSVQVDTAEWDITQHVDDTADLLRSCQLIIAATDTNQSRFTLNSMALASRIPAIFGRALTRAAGGDVLRVRPYLGPCLACVFTEHFLATRQEEISQIRQARAVAPAYMTEADLTATVHVGLSSDILPIANMMVKLALVELSRGQPSGIASLEEDLVADFYIWANRRELVYHNWPKMAYTTGAASILRWYGAKLERQTACLVCGEPTNGVNDEENIFADPQ